MNLQICRKDNGIKAYEMLGISRVESNNIEKGNAKIYFLKLEKIAEIYDKKRDEINIAYEVTIDERN